VRPKREGKHLGKGKEKRRPTEEGDMLRRSLNFEMGKSGPAGDGQKKKESGGGCTRKEKSHRM